MENRKPFELKKAMITYNFFIVLFSVYMCYEASVFGIPNGKSSPWSIVMCLYVFVMTVEFPCFEKGGIQRLSSCLPQQNKITKLIMSR